MIDGMHQELLLLHCDGGTFGWSFRPDEGRPLGRLFRVAPSGNVPIHFDDDLDPALSPAAGRRSVCVILCRTWDWDGQWAIDVDAIARLSPQGEVIERVAARLDVRTHITALHAVRDDDEVVCTVSVGPDTGPREHWLAELDAKMKLKRLVIRLREPFWL